MAADPDAPTVMRLSPRDNVVQRHVPVGQKLAAEPIAAGAPILKYHCPIGIARQPLAPGALITARNVERDYRAPLASPG